MKLTRAQMSEAYWLGALLTVVGGFLDAYTYATRGGVFANAQTGNIVLLAIGLARGEFGALLRYLVPIAAFALGVVVAELARDAFRNHPALHWRQVIVGAEFLILLAVAFVPHGAWDGMVNVAVSFVCAMQVEAFRKIRGNALATTMCTGNLRSGTELLHHALRDRDRAALNRALQYYGILLFFGVGVAVGVWTTAAAEEYAILLCCALLAVAFAAMFLRGEETGVG